MILRKPYAILIKYFKTIHIVMFVIFAYLVFALRKIYVFFANYIKTTNFTYFENMTDKYVPWILFFLILVILGLSIGILLLMNKKEKPVLFYKIMIAYSIFLLVILIYFVTFFNSLATTTYEPLRVVVNRDIILFAYIANYFFVIFTFIRGFGFDIKKFSFDKDKKELNLEESDNEEYELNVNIEKEDIKNFFHRQRRELSYYIRENKAILLIIGGILLISIGLFSYYNIFVENRVYKEGEEISVKSLIYKVNSSRVTSNDKFGQEISSTDDYLIVDLSIINNGNSGHIGEESIRVHINDDYYYPHTSSCDLFSDMGTCYKNQEIKSNMENRFVVVYKISKEYQDIYMEILKGKGEYEYNRVLLSYRKDKLKEEKYTVGETFKLDGQDIRVEGFLTLDKATYNYQDCIGGKCSTFTKKVLPNTGDTILSVTFSDTSTLSQDFLNSAIGIKYNDKIINGKSISMIAQNGNTVYYSVPEYLRTSYDYKLIITTRTTQYNISVREVEYE